MSDPRETHVRRAHLGVMITLIAVTAVAYLAAALLTAPDLPSRLATHFNFDGVPNDTMATPAALVVFGSVCVGVPTLLLAVFAAGQWWRGGSSRLMTALITGLTAGLVSLFVQLLLAHRGVTDALDVRLTGWVGLAALGVALGLGVLAAAVLPRPLPQPEPVPATPLIVEPGDHVTWFGQARTGRTALSIMLFSVVVLVAATLLSGNWWLWFLVLPVTVIMLAITTFRVRIDASGLAWRSGIGLPRGHVPLSEVTTVGVSDVRPTDFGGYGIRSVPGKKGLITRAGESLVVRHRDRELVITVDDAATGASVLEGLRLAAGGQ